MVYSDASNTGYGGYIVEHGNMVANGQWSEEETRQSSTWRELCAVRLILESFQTFLRNERVRWFSDNQNVVRIVQYGSRKPPTLRVEALAIFSTCMNNLIRIEPRAGRYTAEKSKRGYFCHTGIDIEQKILYRQTKIP